jgi:crotonobetainyl-CoA:carnitine CoA-transferase CaiB-like acyl-CoA transferase
VADMMADEHFKARGLFEEVEVNGEKRRIPALVPRLSATPGRTDWAGPEVGAFNAEVYQGLLGLAADQLEKFRQQGVI